jgi:hypothetical protein
MLERGLVSKVELFEALEQIRPGLLRYPALNAEAFERQVRRLLEKEDSPEPDDDRS